MKTRQFFFRLFFALSLIGMLSLSSCSKEDDQFEMDYMALELEYEFSQDVLDVADIQISYLDFDGQEKAETIKSKEWKVLLKTKTIPANCAIILKASLKDGVKLKKDSYKIKRELEYEAEEYYKGGLSGWSRSGEKKRNLTCSKEDLEKQVLLLSQSIKFNIVQGTEGNYIMTLQ